MTYLIPSLSSGGARGGGDGHGSMAAIVALSEQVSKLAGRSQPFIPRSNMIPD